MDEHRDVEITSREHLSHMRQVHANVISGGVVLWIIRTNLDRTAVFQQQEMVRCFLV